MIKKLICLATLTLVFIAGQANATCDQQSMQCQKPQQHLDKLAAELDLTAAQKAKIQTYKEQFRTTSKENWKQLKALRGQVSDLVVSDKFDQGKLDSLINQINQIRGDMLKNRIMMQRKLYSLLDDKQKTKYQSLRKEWTEKHHW